MAKLSVTRLGNSIYVLLRLDQGVQGMVLPKLKHARASGNYDYNKIIEEIADIIDKDNALL